MTCSGIDLDSYIEVRGQRSEVRGQRSEVRGQKNRVIFDNSFFN
jgi:hypothetical protein